MLRAAISFFLIGLLAFTLGANNIAGLSIELGRILFIGFLVLATMSVLANLVTGRSKNPLI